MLARTFDESRLIALSVVGSIALHGVALVLGPGLVHEHADENLLEPPRVLSVVLPGAAPEPAERDRRETPAAAPVPRPAPPQRPTRLQAPAPRVEAPPVAAAPSEPSPAPSAPAAAASEVAAAAPATPAVGTARDAAPREAASLPDFRAGYLRNPPPSYPAAARRNREEGTVSMRVLVSSEGAPQRVELERSSGSSTLDAAALATVKTWRFVPARRGGEPQEAWVIVPIVFRLEPGA